MSKTSSSLSLGASGASPNPIIGEHEGLLVGRKIKKDPIFPIKLKMLMAVAPLLPIGLGLLYHFGGAGALNMPDWAQKTCLGTACVTGASQGVVYLCLTLFYSMERRKQRYFLDTERQLETWRAQERAKEKGAAGPPGPDPSCGDKTTRKSTPPTQRKLDEVD